jgi:hypothetical protein
MNSLRQHLAIVIACAVSVAAAVAVLAATSPHRTEPFRIATVRLHELLAEHIATQGSTAMTEEQRLAAASNYAETLEAAVRSLSERESLVLLAPNAVVSGTQDVTDALRDEIARRLKR